MPDWLRFRTRATPHKLAVLCDGRSVSYAELDRLADGFAAGLLARGVQPGERVATRLPNSIEYIALIHAVARVGAVLVPLNTRLTEQEIGYQTGLTEPVLGIGDWRLVTGNWQPPTVTPSELTQSPNHPVIPSSLLPTPNRLSSPPAQRANRKALSSPSTTTCGAPTPRRTGLGSLSTTAG